VVAKSASHCLAKLSFYLANKNPKHFLREISPAHAKKLVHTINLELDLNATRVATMSPCP